MLLMVERTSMRAVSRTSSMLGGFSTSGSTEKIESAWATAKFSNKTCGAFTCIFASVFAIKLLNVSMSAACKPLKPNSAVNFNWPSGIFKSNCEILNTGLLVNIGKPSVLANVIKASRYCASSNLVLLNLKKPSFNFTKASACKCSALAFTFNGPYTSLP